MMETKKIKNLLTGEILNRRQLYRMVSAGEYRQLMNGEIIHKWEHTRSGRMEEIKLASVEQ